MEHGLLLENLLDLAHAPFTHTSTFAKGWPVPDVVKFNAARMLGGNWEPYPIDMAFEPPCMVLSTIGAPPPQPPKEPACQLLLLGSAEYDNADPCVPLQGDFTVAQGGSHLGDILSPYLASVVVWVAFIKMGFACSNLRLLCCDAAVYREWCEAWSYPISPSK